MSMNLKEIKKFFRNIKFIIYSILLVVFVFLLLIGIAELWSPLDKGVFNQILNSIGYWWMWAIFIGFLGVIVDGWVWGDYLYKRIKFDSMMLNISKAQFVKKMNEIEELSWDLTTNDEIRFQMKKEEFKIK
ncbi:MAG: DUF3198 domain-containing protein [Thermoplasmata archaeon]